MNPFGSTVRLAARGLRAPQSEDLPWDDGTVTVTITNAAGIQIGSPAGAVYNGGDDLKRWAFAVPAQSAPGMLTLVWAHQDGEEVVTNVDVRDGQPHPLAILQGFLTGKSGSLTTSSIYPMWKRRHALDLALLALEAECRTRLVPQRSTIQITGTSYGRSVSLDEPWVQRVVACSNPDIVVSSLLLDQDSDTVTFPDGIRAPFTLTIDHGEMGPPPDVAREVAVLASSLLVDGPQDDRGFALNIDGIGGQRMMTAGIGGARFSIPSVEACFRRHRITKIGGA